MTDNYNVLPGVPGPFNTYYKCYPVSMLPGNPREDVERGGKIILPPTALHKLTELDTYPMLFKLTNKNSGKITHCGVLEFIAEEGKVYLPQWMMTNNLSLCAGDVLQVESVSLPIATFTRFQPQSVDFLDLVNPRALLESALRSFACLSAGDIITLLYNERIYELRVLETLPSAAVTIINCDMDVDFAAPVGYKEPEPKPKPETPPPEPYEEMDIEPIGFVAFQGQGNRLDGKKKKLALSPPKPTVAKAQPRVIPKYNYKIGTLKFLRNIRTPWEETEVPAEIFKTFAGKKRSLRD